MPENRVEEPEAPPSILEDLLRRSGTYVQGVVADHIKASVERALDWTLRRTLTYIVAGALFATAAVFMLVAGLEGVKQAGAPVWAAYLGFGLAGILGGGLLLPKPAHRCDRHPHGDCTRR